MITKRAVRLVFEWRNDWASSQRLSGIEASIVATLSNCGVWLRIRQISIARLELVWGHHPALLLRLLGFGFIFRVEL